MINTTNFVSYLGKLNFRNGIWYSDKKNELSYPAEDYMKCFQLEETSFWFRHRNECIVAVMKMYSPGELLFDVGGGNGFIAVYLEKNGIPVALIEPGEPGAENAAIRGLKRIVCATLKDAELPESALSSIGLFDVVEHINEQKKFLSDIKKYIAPGGRIYITVPSLNFLWSDEDAVCGHYRRYTITTLTQVLSEVGFEVEYSTYMFSILIPFVFFLRSIPSRLGIKRDVDSAEKYKKEHTNKPSVFDKMLQLVWSWELKKIKRGKKISWGTSCLVVARLR